MRLLLDCPPELQVSVSGRRARKEVTGVVQLKGDSNLNSGSGGGNREEGFGLMRLQGLISEYGPEAKSPALEPPISSLSSLTDRGAMS